MIEKIYCTHCRQEVEAFSTPASSIFGDKFRFKDNIIFVCPNCKNYVETSKDLIPLGVIPTKELRKAKNYILSVLNSMLEQKMMTRKEAYLKLSKSVYANRKVFKISDIRDLDEARKVYAAVKKLREDIKNV